MRPPASWWWAPALGALACGPGPIVTLPGARDGSTFQDLDPASMHKLADAERLARAIDGPYGPLERLLSNVTTSAWDHRADPSSRRGDTGEVILGRLRAAFPARFAFVGYWTVPWSREIGFDGRGDRVALGSRWLGRLDARGYAGILWHEVAHKAGYEHDGDRRQGTECSVPYLVGDAARAAAAWPATGGWGALPDDACPGLRAAVAASR
jgi:hypothetical protein